MLTKSDIAAIRAARRPRLPKHLHLVSAFDFPSAPCDVEPREREPRIVDQGKWEPVSNRFLSYGFFMFCCGCLAAWAFIAAWQHP